MSPYPERHRQPGFMTYDLAPVVVSEPPTFPGESLEEVRYAEVPDDTHTAGYLWVSADGALGYEKAARARPAGLNTAVAINGEIVKSHASGLTAPEAFRELTVHFAPNSAVANVRAVRRRSR